MSPTLNSIKANILNPFIAFLGLLALVYFLYGLFKFVYEFDNPEAKKAGKQHMVWGVVGLAIMVSAYGIIKIITDTIRGIAS